MSSKADSLKTVAVTTSLDGTILACSEPVSTWTELRALSFDQLEVTMQPHLKGHPFQGHVPHQSFRLKLVQVSTSKGALKVLYRRG